MRTNLLQIRYWFYGTSSQRSYIVPGSKSLSIHQAATKVLALALQAGIDGPFLLASLRGILTHF